MGLAKRPFSAGKNCRRFLDVASVCSSAAPLARKDHAPSARAPGKPEALLLGHGTSCVPRPVLTRLSRRARGRLIAIGDGTVSRCREEINSEAAGVERSAPSRPAAATPSLAPMTSGHDREGAAAGAAAAGGDALDFHAILVLNRAMRAMTGRLPTPATRRRPSRPSWPSTSGPASPGCWRGCGTGAAACSRTSPASARRSRLWPSSPRSSRAARGACSSCAPPEFVKSLARRGQQVHRCRARGRVPRARGGGPAGERLLSFIFRSVNAPPGTPTNAATVPAVTAAAPAPVSDAVPAAAATPAAPGS